MSIRTSVGMCLLAGLTAASVAAQQPAVDVDGDNITMRGCVGRADAQGVAPATLVWTRSDIMLAGVTAIESDAPNPVGTSGIAGRVFYWLEDDEDLAKHVGQLVEVKGELEDFDEGEIEIERKGEFTEIELDLGGKEEKMRIPTAWLGATTADDDKEIDIVGRRIDVEDIRVLGPCPAR